MKSREFKKIIYPLIIAFTLIQAVNHIQGKPSNAQSTEDQKLKKVMHRIAAGTPDKDGWYRATSTEGNYEILLPFPYNDFTFKLEGDPGRKLKMHGVGATSKEGIKVQILKIEAVNPVKGKDLLKELREAYSSRSDLISIEDTKALGLDAFDLHARSNAAETYMRFIKAESYYYSLLIEAPLELNFDLKPYVNKIFTSLVETNPR